MSQEPLQKDICVITLCLENISPLTHSAVLEVADQIEASGFGIPVMKKTPTDPSEKLPRTLRRLIDPKMSEVSGFFKITKIVSVGDDRLDVTGEWTRAHYSCEFPDNAPGEADGTAPLTIGGKPISVDLAGIGTPDGFALITGIFYDYPA